MGGRVKKIDKFYNVWSKIKTKYNNGQSDVCDEWLYYENFEKWCLENCEPNSNYHLIKLNDNEPYCANNCIFLPPTEARKYQVNSNFVTYNNKTLSLTQWERESGISRHVIRDRLKRGWSVEKIFETPVATHKKEKDTNERLRYIFQSMKARCYNEKCEKYKNYGAKGIKICDEWLNDFNSFKTWALENGYTNDLTIERKDITNDYCPENCTWITVQEQSKNRSNNHLITYNGETMILQDWADRVGINSTTLRRRLKRGWSVENALFTPSKNLKQTK